MPLELEGFEGAGLGELGSHGSEYVGKDLDLVCSGGMSLVRSTARAGEG